MHTVCGIHGHNSTFHPITSTCATYMQPTTILRTIYYNTIKRPSKLILTATLHTINRNNNYGTITLHVITSKNIRYTVRVYRT